MDSYVESAYDLFMAETFGEQLRLLIKASGMTQDEFAKKVKIAPTSVSNVIVGVRTPPPDKLDDMANTLGLHGRIRDRFMDLAMIEHLPRELRSRYSVLLRRLERWEASHKNPP